MFIDIFIVILFIWALFNGWRNGFLKEVVSAGGFIVGLLVAALFYQTLGEYLTVDGSKVNMVTSIVAFLILWIMTPCILGFVANNLTRALRGMRLGLPNSLLGAAVSALKFLILISCVLNMMNVLGIMNPERTRDSHLYGPVKGALTFIFHEAATAASEQLEEMKNDTTWIYLNSDPAAQKDTAQ